MPQVDGPLLVEFSQSANGTVEQHEWQGRGDQGQHHPRYDLCRNAPQWIEIQSAGFGDTIIRAMMTPESAGRNAELPEGSHAGSID